MTNQTFVILTVLAGFGLAGCNGGDSRFSVTEPQSAPVEIPEPQPEPEPEPQPEPEPVQPFLTDLGFQTSEQEVIEDIHIFGGFTLHAYTNSVSEGLAKASDPESGSLPRTWVLDPADTSADPQISTSAFTAQSDSEAVENLRIDAALDYPLFVDDPDSAISFMCIGGGERFSVDTSTGDRTPFNADRNGKIYTGPAHVNFSLSRLGADWNSFDLEISGVDRPIDGFSLEPSGLELTRCTDLTFHGLERSTGENVLIAAGPSRATQVSGEPDFQYFISEGGAEDSYVETAGTIWADASSGQAQLLYENRDGFVSAVATNAGSGAIFFAESSNDSGAITIKKLSSSDVVAAVGSAEQVPVTAETVVTFSQNPFSQVIEPGLIEGLEVVMLDGEETLIATHTRKAFSLEPKPASASETEIVLQRFANPDNVTRFSGTLAVPLSDPTSARLLEGSVVGDCLGLLTNLKAEPGVLACASGTEPNTVVRLPL